MSRILKKYPDLKSTDKTRDLEGHLARAYWNAKIERNSMRGEICKYLIPSVDGVGVVVDPLAKVEVDQLMADFEKINQELARLESKLVAADEFVDRMALTGWDPDRLTTKHLKAELGGIANRSRDTKHLPEVLAVMSARHSEVMKAYEELYNIVKV